MSGTSLTVVTTQGVCLGCGAPAVDGSLDDQRLCPTCTPVSVGSLQDPSLRTWSLCMAVAHLLDAVGGRALPAVVVLQLPAAALALPSVRAVRAAGHLTMAAASLPMSLLAVAVWAKLQRSRG